ncbi:MAG: TadE family type IV pilus minor pilin [Nocardioidaceae bacterium]
MRRAGRADGPCARTPRSQRGAVTAETAVVLPVLVAVALGLAWVLSLAVTQVRVVDAAREVARAAARDECRADAVARGQRVAPDGARISVRVDAADVVATVAADVRGPAGLFAFLPPVRVSSDAVAAREQP